jgi:predicted O-methyltransferase YrrM
MSSDLSRKIKKCIVKTPLLGPVVLLAARLFILSGYAKHKLYEAGRWLIYSRETTNFTYKITPLSRAYLINLISCITGVSTEKIEVYAQELEKDENLSKQVREGTLGSKRNIIADATTHFGRRLGWYLLVRTTKPKLVVETGIDKGLGALVLCSAILRNTQEGFPGKYLGLDINPEAGFLLKGVYASVGKILIGDSAKTIPTLPTPIDIFINDSDHSATHEKLEYQLVQGKLSSNSIIIGDNAHCNDELLSFSKKTARNFAFWSEAPEGHWYPGGGIGLSYLQSKN